MKRIFELLFRLLDGWLRTFCWIGLELCTKVTFRGTDKIHLLSVSVCYVHIRGKAVCNQSQSLAVQSQSFPVLACLDSLQFISQLPPLALFHPQQMLSPLALLKIHFILQSERRFSGQLGQHFLYLCCSSSHK